MTAWVWVVYALAVARVTGLITQDQLTDPARRAILRRLDEDSTAGQQIGYLITCPWCASIWVAIPAALLAYWWGSSAVLLLPALALAMSQLTGMASGHGRS